MQVEAIEHAAASPLPRLEYGMAPFPLQRRYYRISMPLADCILITSATRIKHDTADHAGKRNCTEKAGTLNNHKDRLLYGPQ